MKNKERVDVPELYDWVVSTIKSYRERFGELVYQSEWIPLPDYFFKYKNDKIFSSGVQISYNDDFFSFGVVTLEYVEPFNPVGFCRIENVMNNDAVFQDELGTMLERILNRQEDHNRNNHDDDVMLIKKYIVEAVKNNIPSCPYEITDYLNYSEKQEEQLLKEMFNFKPFEAKNKNKIVKHINKNTDKNINKNADEIYEQKYNELRSLFYSPDTEKYPLPEIINPGDLKIKADLLKKGDPLIIEGVGYIVEENVIFENHKKDFIESSGGDNIDIKVTHRAHVSLYRESDNNLYSMDVYIKEEKGNNMYYFDEIVEEQLYIHNVTINLPEDDRPVAISSYFTDSKFKEIYKDYNHEKAYKREDFNNYLEENGNRNNIDHEVLKLFINEFENNKDLLSADFDVRKWADNVININYGLNLSAEQPKPSVRKRKM